MIRHYLTKCSLFFMMICSLTGCLMDDDIRADDPAFSPSLPVVNRHTQPAEGAIYQANVSNRLFEDHSTFHVGDIIVVNLIEQTSANNSANTTVDKSTELTVANPTILGVTPSFKSPKFNSFFKSSS